MCGLGLNERDLDGANEFSGGKVEYPIPRTIIVLPNEHVAKRIG
jgi:hypothetical protein